ncbi:nucleoside diphosphate kinase B-like [Peromyscus californicus insignis]|uniref:nucleoside diphosphate kinase B-like n=1 Tax=Peromyscus californicus insignis TaxID=564181 RepID=UPI0022A74165|nr:nucleoside diphosphate kinase B-like [Peromyscus californicus insignis]
MANLEDTFIAIKSDGMHRCLLDELLVAMKFLQASGGCLKRHCLDPKDHPFFPGLVKYMNSGPMVSMAWEGLNVVQSGLVTLEETNPADSKPGTI